MVYYLWVLLLALANSSAWLANIISLPGNWLIVVFAAIYAYFLPEENGQGLGWWSVAFLCALAAIGEVVEFAAGAAVAGKRGGSRRGMALAVIGTMGGSILGAVISLPIPIIGPVIGALLGGALGAYSGAVAGEMWKGKTFEEGSHIGEGAAIGKLLGTAGKLCIGALMVVFATIDSLL
jgi:uncharacterized protein YqgC (DUF456 family)